MRLVLKMTLAKQQNLKDKLNSISLADIIIDHRCIIHRNKRFFCKEEQNGGNLENAVFIQS